MQCEKTCFNCMRMHNLEMCSGVSTFFIHHMERIITNLDTDEFKVLARNVGHFGHRHFGLGRFGPDISATDVSATENAKGGPFGQIINFGLGVCMHKCVMHF